jgi:hypothetical protein
MRGSLDKSLVESRESLEEFLPMSNHPVTKRLGSLWESLCWANYSASRLLQEKFARQVVASRVAPYVEPPSDKALVESLLGESRVNLRHFDSYSNSDEQWVEEQRSSCITTIRASQVGVDLNG